MRRLGTEPHNRAALFMQLGLSLVLLAYFLVWLPQPVTGLSFIGLEMGEWVKFIPAVAAGDIVPGRTLFYVPPVVAGLIMILWTVGWSNRAWQTWAMRGLAVLVAWLAFPSIEAILEEDADQWLLRLTICLFVAAAAAGVAWLPGRLERFHMARWASVILLAVLGALLPTWAFAAVAPEVAAIFREQVGAGPGVWVNLVGQLLIVIAAVSQLRAGAQLPKAV